MEICCVYDCLKSYNYAINKDDMSYSNVMLVIKANV